MAVAMNKDPNMQEMISHFTDLAKTLEDISPLQDVSKNALSNNAVVLLPQFKKDSAEKEKTSFRELIHPEEKAAQKEDKKVAPTKIGKS